ncbi:uncharacterized protein LOC135166582 [Diachasmimorpha longicaudata]|uniref:uncharacterized protein LOC135166582 n=1 Tax=Diachasmimorpha longicaudata TaxID=58733 RepID=UPI0030B89E21
MLANGFAPIPFRKWKVIYSINSVITGKKSKKRCRERDKMLEQLLNKVKKLEERLVTCDAIQTTSENENAVDKENMPSNNQEHLETITSDTTSEGGEVIE